MKELQCFDGELFDYICEEQARQKRNLELIASENFVSSTVMEAAGSCLTNKYAEGYPGRRYYGGCEVVDKVENLAIDRLKSLYDAEHANVQPHSGSQANQAVYFAMVPAGEKMLAMDLSHGGHLTHGSPVNLSGSYYRVSHYGVTREEEVIDYDRVEQMAVDLKPKMIVAGASAYPRVIDFKRFREIADRVGAYLMVDMAHIAGLIAAGLHPSPVPYAHFVTSTTHKTLRGIRGGFVLSTEEHAKAIDKALFPGIQGGPLMHIIAAKAVGFKEAAQASFKEYQQNILENTQSLAKGLQGFGMRLVSGGTDNHLVLVDLNNLEITGKDAENLLDRIGITVNKNTIPFETRSPFVTSGIRIGTAAVTTRGMGTEDMQEIARFIYEGIKNKDDEGKLKHLEEETREFSTQFNLY